MRPLGKPPPPAARRTISLAHESLRASKAKLRAPAPLHNTPSCAPSEIRICVPGNPRTTTLLWETRDRTVPATRKHHNFPEGFPEKRTGNCRKEAAAERRSKVHRTTGNPRGKKRWSPRRQGPQVTCAVKSCSKIQAWREPMPIIS